ncbi:ADP-ribosylglycohydrolase family protein [Dermabacteraceae bacterium P13264]
MRILDDYGIADSAGRREYENFQRGLRAVYTEWQRFVAHEGDPCELFGEGWVGDEAFFTSLAVFLKHPENPRAVFRELVYTGGDSDSLAAIGGSFVGAPNGYDAFGFSCDGEFECRYNTELREARDFILETHGVKARP